MGATSLSKSTTLAASCDCDSLSDPSTNAAKHKAIDAKRIEANVNVGRLIGNCKFQVPIELETRRINFMLSL
jgi:hypothetical protein